MGSDEDRDLTSGAARRRRALAGVLAGAVLATGGTAVALADTGTSGSSTDTPDTSAPALIQDEGQTETQPRDRDGDGRLCPEEGGSGSGDQSGGDTGYPGTTEAPTEL